jgi:phosphoglycerate kinase
MSSELRTIDDLDVEGRRVLLRADFNVPLSAPSAGVAVRVADDTRIRAALSTIDELRRRGARLVLISHLGRPKGPDAALSMQPVADRLGKLTGVSVPLAPAVMGPPVRELTERLQPGQMLMVENVRFEAGEMRNDPALASAVAELADLYVDDAFACAHRAHASTCGVGLLLPSAAGRLMEREVHALSAIVERPARPLVAILGGATIGDKIGIVQRFLELADLVCIGGGMCFPFLAALGHSVGQSLCPREDVERARMALEAAASSTDRVVLPKDLLLARWGDDVAAVTRMMDGLDVPDGWMGLDIGTKTADRYASRVASATTVFWNGPVGRFELPQFAAGTRAIAEAVASTSATTVVGGGETSQALRRFRLQDRVNHLSSAGGAMLAFLEGRQLPGLQVLLARRAGRSAPRSARWDTPLAGRAELA